MPLITVLLLLLLSPSRLLVPVIADTYARACTFEGFYDAGAATTEPCPGALPCDPGFFCAGGERRPCPAGTYGAEPQLRTRACSAMCPAGFFCPEGSTAPRVCGGAHVYCPLGSTEPRLVPAGFYSLGHSALQRDRVAPCPVGMFCTQGTKQRCPAGTYGATTKLTTPQCTQLCPVGSYCPEPSAAPIACPAGTFGDRAGLTDAACAGRCPQGFFCPQGSTSATAHACGFGAFCPEGSASPTRAVAGAYVVNGNSGHASAQFACPVGSFCRGDGTAELCPGGTFGDTTGLNTSACAGPCTAGYFCPQGSTSAVQQACGGAHVYCPRGSAAPRRVFDGFYSVGALSLSGHDQRAEDAETRSAQRRCEPGHYCALGVRMACPAGTFGNASGLAAPACSGLCAPGFFCPERSMSARALQCGSSNQYCPEGSVLPLRALPGYCTIGGGADALTRTLQRPALAGEFAWRGTCFACPGGTYGVAERETNPRCSGPCARGFYCPPGSVSATERECGAADVYCPEGVAAPLRVQQGYYSTTQDADLCPPGMFRDIATTTVNSYMDIATGRSPISVSYGDASYPLAKCVMCPLGTFKPQSGDDAALCVRCPEFTTTSVHNRRSCDCFRRAGGRPLDDARVLELRFNTKTLACEQVRVDSDRSGVADASDSVFAEPAQRPCERGYFCTAGVRAPCPGGRFGGSAFETRALCSGPCAAGYYCPLASTNSTARVCGSAEVFCPAGSAVPTPVLPGYYSVRSSPSLPPATQLQQQLTYEARTANANEAIRDTQTQCEAGYYCVGGQRFACPSGRYGDQRGETSPLCAGSCARGYFCPPGSVSPNERACGGDDRICRTGATLPELVSPGYYSLGTTNATRFAQTPCEPGYFCTDGVKYQCPEGSFGATAALQHRECSGLCAAGYYCPSYPNAPSVSATQRECGNATVFCPAGTGNAPLMVRSGYYSIGAGDGSGDARNTTRTAQRVCPRGSYCRRGIVIPCPDGTYGDVDGLSDTYCRGWCPPGYACPRGTSDYSANACALGTYAPAGSARCIECPSKSDVRTPAVLALFRLLSDMQEQQPCIDRRECCFFG